MSHVFQMLGLPACVHATQAMSGQKSDSTQQKKRSAMVGHQNGGTIPQLNLQNIFLFHRPGRKSLKISEPGLHTRKRFCIFAQGPMRVLCCNPGPTWTDVSHSKVPKAEKKERLQWRLVILPLPLRRIKPSKTKLLTLVTTLW